MESLCLKVQPVHIWINFIWDLQKTLPCSAAYNRPTPTLAQTQISKVASRVCIVQVQQNFDSPTPTLAQTQISKVASRVCISQARKQHMHALRAAKGHATTIGYSQWSVVWQVLYLFVSVLKNLEALRKGKHDPYPYPTTCVDKAYHFCWLPDLSEIDMLLCFVLCRHYVYILYVWITILVFSCLYVFLFMTMIIYDYCDSHRLFTFIYFVDLLISSAAS